MTHLPNATPLVLFPSSSDITSISNDESWLLVCHYHYLDDTILGKPLHHIITVWLLVNQGWAFMMSVSFPTLLSSGKVLAFSFLSNNYDLPFLFPQKLKLIKIFLSSYSYSRFFYIHISFAGFYLSFLSLANKLVSTFTLSDPCRI